MKRMIRVILILILCLSVKTVYAENYKIKELIPYKVDTTIHTDNFSYKGIYFDYEGVHFNGIKNLTDDKLPVSISIGLFDKKGKNVGTINHCDKVYFIDGKEEMSFVVYFTKDYLGDKNKIEDIKYISVLSDNINCRTGGSKDYIGKSVDTLGISHTEKFDNQTELFLSILTILAGAFLVFIVYKLIFTRAYRNVDGNEIRKAYDEINKELREMREEIEEVKEEETEPTKSEEIIKQEEDAKNEDKESTDLHNLYK